MRLNSARVPITGMDGSNAMSDTPTTDAQPTPHDAHADIRYDVVAVRDRLLYLTRLQTPVRLPIRIQDQYWGVTNPVQ